MWVCFTFPNLSFQPHPCQRAILSFSSNFRKAEANLSMCTLEIFPNIHLKRKRLITGGIQSKIHIAFRKKKGMLLNLFCSTCVSNQVLNNPHSPAKYRIIGPLSNSEDFVNAFECPTDSNMNRKEKCLLW